MDHVNAPHSPSGLSCRRLKSASDTIGFAGPLLAKAMRRYQSPLNSL
jgi:hypothetical protein